MISHFGDPTDVNQALESRVLIIEGISGSGKDTFQAYLKEKLEGRQVYDYSEGDLLHSWKHFPIEGILEIRVRFMKLFVNHVRDIVNQDANAVFLLNRFHLSAYVTTIMRQPELEKQYDEIIDVLRTLPVHVFILQLGRNEIKQRSLHAERSGAWRKLQQQMVTKDGFRDSLDRYSSQQKLMIEAAKKQRIPYSLIKVAYTLEIGSGEIHVAQAQNVLGRGVLMRAADTKIPRRKRGLPRSL
jgi:thymidylate kinase